MPRSRRGQGSAVLPGTAPGQLTGNQRRRGSRGLEGRGTLIGGDSGNKSVSCGFARSNSGGCPSVCRHGCIHLAWLRHGGLCLLLAVCRCWPSECSWLADVRYSNIWVVIMRRPHTQPITPRALPIRSRQTALVPSAAPGSLTMASSLKRSPQRWCDAVARGWRMTTPPAVAQHVQQPNMTAIPRHLRCLRNSGGQPT